MKRLSLTTLGLLTLGVILSPVYAFEGIVYEATVDGVGTITICNPDDDTQCLTMMDRNLGASVAGIGAASDGYYYQRGNNYGFRGTINSTTTLATWDDSYDNSGYYSETFIESSSSPYDYWSDGVSHDNLWGGSGDNAANGYGYTGGVVLNVTGRQGPCPEGYHVPSWGEWSKTVQWWASGYKLLGNTFTTLTISATPYFKDRIAGRAFQDDFKIPFAGSLDYENVGEVNHGHSVFLSSSSPNSTNTMILTLSYYSVGSNSSYYRAYATSVRCFKNSELSPALSGAQAKFESNGATSVGNVMVSDGYVIAPSITRYGYEILGWSTDSGATVAEYAVGDIISDSDTTYYAITRKFPVCEETLDETVDTLTICNPSNTGECLTMMDKNLGASVAGIGPDSDGCMYQWGNNYCFPSDGTIATTGTLATWDERFNNSGYYSDIFIKGTIVSKSDYWSDNTPSNHDRLWGGTANETTYPVTNPTDRRGPCPEGYHVPSYSEWNKTVMRLNSHSSDTRIKIRHFEASFLIPFAGSRIAGSANLSLKNSHAFLWSSSPYGMNARYLTLSTYYMNAYSSNYGRASANSVRCFKDSYLSSSSATFLPNGATSVGGATPVLSCTDQLSECNPGLLTGCTTTVVMPDITRDGWTVLGWSTDSGATEAEYSVGETVTLSGDTTFYAITSKVYTATFDKNGADSIGANSASCTVYNTQTSCGLGVGDITICNPSDPTQCLTMMDRNLGASSAGTGQCSYGNYYQRGNNYGFSSGGNITGDMVDASGYGPGNYYNSGIFIVRTGDRWDWSTVANNNLWGGSGDGVNNNYGYPMTNPTDRRGPCPEGYHVPSAGEWGNMLLRYIAEYTGMGNNVTLQGSMPFIYIESNYTVPNLFRNHFLIPRARSLQKEGILVSAGDISALRSSSPYDLDHIAGNLRILGGILQNQKYPRFAGMSVRCFKDTSLTTKLYGQASVSAPSITRAGWTVLGWDYSPDSTTGVYQPCDEIELTGDTTLYAITKPLTATFLPGETVNKTLKSLATGATVTNTNDVDTLIQQIVRTGTIPAGVTTGLLSTNDSEVPIIAWFDDGILYYYSEADVIYLNQNSSYMFRGIRSGNYIDTNGWDTSSVTNMEGMFVNCSSLTGLDVSEWDTSNVTNMVQMFNYCRNLTSLDVSGWNTSNVTNMQSMFAYCNSLESLDIGNWDTSNVTKMRSMFRYSSSLKSLDIGNWDTSKVVDMYYMFSDCSSLTGINVSNWDTSSVTNMNGMFNDCSSLKSLNVSNWNTSGVTNMSYMFSNCINLRSLDVSGWNTSSVRDMSSMFRKCRNLTGIDVSNWDTSKVTNMSSMFQSCSNLAGLDVSGWNTSKVTDMSYMFFGGESLTALDVTHWDTSSVTNMNLMFGLCLSLNTIYASTGFITSGVTNSNNMFNRTQSLVGGHGTKYNQSYIDKTLAVLDSETQSGYLTYNIAVSYRTRSGVELARQVINVGDTTVAPSITGYNVLGYYSNTGLSSTFDFSQELRKYTEVYVDRVCADGYRLADGACEKILTATFLPGQTVNTRLKSLATGATVTSLDVVDTLIQQIVRTGSIPAGVTTGLLSTNDSETPIIAWFDNGILYYYSDADILYLNQNSNNMFYNIQSGTYIDTSGWDTSKVTNMGYMFASCRSLTELDVSDWDTSKVTIMYDMFFNCNNLTRLDVGGWNTSKVTNMSYMFYGCNRLIELDVSGWDTSKVTTMGLMFAGCKVLTGLDVSRWNTSSVTNMSEMFTKCYSLVKLDVGGWDTSKVTNMGSMFSDCSSLTGLDVSEWDTSNVTNMSYMFNGCNSLTELDVSEWDTSKVTTMSYMFAGCKVLTELDVSNFVTSGVTSMSAMFNGCSSLTEIDVGGWETSNVTNMSQMFMSCSSLTGLDLSDWNTSKVTNMSQMFSDCGSLTGLDLSNWDTSKVTNMGNMFTRCSSLTELDVSDWDTSSVTNMADIFNQCNALETIYASSGFITSGVTNSTYMFFNTPKLIGGHGTKSPSLGATKSGAVLDSETQSGYLTYDIAVSYRTRSGVELARQIIDVGDTTVAPTIIRTGYAVSGWYTDTGLTTLFDFSQSLRKYTELYVMWKCDTGYMLSGDGVTCIPLTYEVRHFIKNAGELSYTLSGTEIFTGIAGEQVYFDDLSQTYPSCIVYSRGSLTGDETGPGEIETKTDIAGDGSTVINLFYDRNTYTVDLSRDFGIDVVEGAGTYECGQEVQIRAYPIDGYHFDMWEGNAINVDKILTFLDVFMEDTWHVGDTGTISVHIHYFDGGNSVSSEEDHFYDAGGTVTLEIDGHEYTAPVIDGYAIFSINNLSVGSKTVFVRYSGDGKYTENVTSAQFQVNKIKPSISVTSNDISLGRNENVVINVYGVTGVMISGRCLCLLNEVGYYGDVINDNGRVFAKVVIPDLGVGSYVSKCYYEGNENYLPSDYNSTAFSVTRKSSSGPIT